MLTIVLGDTKDWQSDVILNLGAAGYPSALMAAKSAFQ